MLVVLLLLQLGEKRVILLVLSVKLILQGLNILLLLHVVRVSLIFFFLQLVLNLNSQVFFLLQRIFHILYVVYLLVEALRLVKLLRHVKVLLMGGRRLVTCSQVRVFLVRDSLSRPQLRVRILVQRGLLLHLIVVRIVVADGSSEGGLRVDLGLSSRASCVRVTFQAVIDGRLSGFVVFFLRGVKHIFSQSDYEVISTANLLKFLFS